MIDFEDPRTWDEELTDVDALSLGIFALNTLAEPETSTPAQMSTLDFFTDGAVDRLVTLRDRMRQNLAEAQNAGPDAAHL